MKPWQPVISDPGVAARADGIVRRTARFFRGLATGDAPTASPRLDRFLARITGIDGVPAVALFHAYLALERGTPDAVEGTTTWLDRAIDVTSGLEEPKPWLATGVAGCAWVVAHVMSRLGAPQDGEDSPTRDVDETLAALLRDADGQIDAELTMGLAGLGTWSLEGLPHPSALAGVEEVVRQLRAQADVLPNGFAWRKRAPGLSREDRRRHPHGLYNLGVPHGVPGVIGFLARVCASDAASPTARELLEGSVGWLRDQRAPVGASVFPCLVDPLTGPVEGESRLAWCYGDLGIAASLLQAARALHRPDWERDALALAERAATRRPADSGVEDGMFCHGAAGVAHLFNRLHQASGRPALRTAAERWYGITVGYDDPANGATGYRCLVREPQDAPTDDAPIVLAESYGLAVGVAGVALALLAGIGRVTPDWDRALGTAIPAGGPDGG